MIYIYSWFLKLSQRVSVIWVQLPWWNSLLHRVSGEPLISSPAPVTICLETGTVTGYPTCMLTVTVEDSHSYRKTINLVTFFKYWPGTFLPDWLISMSLTFIISTNIMIISSPKNNCIEYNKDIYINFLGWQLECFFVVISHQSHHWPCDGV